MKKIAIAYIIYALLIALGGVAALLVAKSTISFILSITTASFIFLLSVLFLNREPWSIYGCYLLNILLASVFFMRFKVTEKFMPAGMLLLISLIVLVLSLRTHYQYNQKKVY